MRVVADALAFTQLAVCHQVEFVGVFGKPDGSIDGDSAFAERCEADIALAVDGSRDGGHWDIVKCLTCQSTMLAIG